VQAPGIVQSGNGHGVTLQLPFTLQIGAGTGPQSPGIGQSTGGGHKFEAGMLGNVITNVHTPLTCSLIKVEPGPNILMLSLNIKNCGSEFVTVHVQVVTGVDAHIVIASKPNSCITETL